MHYTLHQLQVFLKVAQLRSVTKASEELNMTQPAVSIQLKNLQDQFDIPLTEVVGRQLYVTEFGKEILVMAERIINEVYAINYKTLAYRGQLTGRLSVSVVSTGKYVMPYFLSDFLHKNPGIDLSMDVTNKMEVIESLKNNEVDFALVSVLPDGLKVHEEILFDNELFLITANKVVKKKSVLKKDLINMPIIFREEGSGTRHVMEKFFDKSKLNIRKKMELTSNEAVKQAVIAGLGNAILPLIGLRNELSNRTLQILKCEGLPIKSKWRIIWLAGKKFSPAAQAYLDHLRNNKSSIMEQHFSWMHDVSNRFH